MSKEQQKASIQQLLRSEDEAHVKQGIELARALEDPELWSVFAKGISISTGERLSIENAAIKAHVKEEFQANVALWIAWQEGLLTNLSALDLRECAVRDLSPLKGLTQLTVLRLGHCKSVRDLSPLEGLKNLSRLFLRCTAVSDLSPLKGMALTTLAVGGTFDNKNTVLRDLSPLKGLTNLTLLDLWYCVSVRDLSPLEGLKNLTTLDLSSTAVKDLSPLKGLKNLTTLNLSSCRNVSVWSRLWLQVSLPNCQIKT